MILNTDPEWEVSDPRKIMDLAQAEYSRGNMPFAVIMCYALTDKLPRFHDAWHLLGLVAWKNGMLRHAIRFFERAALSDPNNVKTVEALTRVRSAFAQSSRDRQALPWLGDREQPHYLLIKSWGFGFWADVTHVLAQLLICEITGRKPVTYWGRTCRYGDGTPKDHFVDFFAPLSDATIDDIEATSGAFFPELWNSRNLRMEDGNRLRRPAPRWRFGVDFLGKDATIAVSDYFTDIAILRHWLDPAHSWSGLSSVEIHRRLAEKYLRPIVSLERRAGQFCAERLPGSDFIAVHVRGSDKLHEDSRVISLQERYPELINPWLNGDRSRKIFLMTDDSDVAGRYVNMYGDRVVLTQAYRTNGTVGIHHRDKRDGRMLGEDVLVDVLIARRARFFVGFGTSNVSCSVYYLRDWPQESVRWVVEPEHLTRYHWFLYMPPSLAKAAVRRSPTPN